MVTLKVTIDDETARGLRKAAKRSHKRSTDVAAETLRRQFAKKSAVAVNDANSESKPRVLQDEDLPPILKELRGMLKGVDVRGDAHVDYREWLAEKYR